MVSGDRSDGVGVVEVRAWYNRALDTTVLCLTF